VATVVWVKKHKRNNYTGITENHDQYFLRSEVQVFLHKVPCNTAALCVYSQNCTIITALRYIHSPSKIKLQPNYGNRQSSFLCCILRTVNSGKLPSSHPKPPCVQQMFTSRTSGYSTWTSKFSGNIRSVSNFSPFHQTFLVIFFFFFVFLLQSARECVRNTRFGLRLPCRSVGCGSLWQPSGDLIDHRVMALDEGETYNAANFQAA